MKIAVFFHIADIDGWQFIYDEMIYSLEKSVLQKSEYYYEKLCDIKDFENPTLNFMRDFCIENKDFGVLYVHSKGITKPKSNSIIDWRRSMTYHLIGRANECIEMLKKYDTVGCNYMKHYDVEHWQGNFFWATSNYIATLSKVEDVYLSPKCREVWNDRHKAEAWVFSGCKPSYFQMYHHRIDPYLKRNPFNLYSKYRYKKSKIEFLEARYFCREKEVNVLDKIKSEYDNCRGNVLLLPVDNRLGVDPAPGYPKKLFLSYLKDGKMMEITLKESQTFYIEVSK